MSSSPPENLMDFLINEGNGVKGLSQLNLKKIPDKFIQPPTERFESIKVATDVCVPVIDVCNWDDPKVAQSICEAATKWGFFQITNHGIPTNVLEDVITCAHNFFESPVEERRKYLKENTPTSTVVLKSSFSAWVDEYMDWKDHLVHLVDQQQHDQESKLWPRVTRDPVLNYVGCAKPIIKKLLGVLMNGINVKRMDEEKESCLMGLLVASLVYYPECSSPDLAVGSGRHSDVSSITLLLQDDTGGLYARLEGDQWVHVAPTRGALTVNIGDALQIMSNGRYKSIKHRVFLIGATSRVSVPIFANALSDSIIGPLPEVLHAGEEPIYKNLLFADYLNNFLSKGQDGKNAIRFARI